MGGFFAGGTFKLQIPDGTVAAPGFPYASDLTTGFYRPAGGYFGISAGGVSGGLIDANGNTGYGRLSLTALTTGSSNTAFGTGALKVVADGIQNTAFGWTSMLALTSGVQNVCVGNASGQSLTTGTNNVAVGSSALQLNVAGAGNICIGNSAGAFELGSYKLYIAPTGTSVPLIGGVFDPAGLYAGTLNFTLTSATFTFSATSKASIQAGGFRGSEVANGKQGTATLVAGTVTVNNTSITANSRILITAQETGVLAGVLRVTGRVVGTSFTIGSSNAGDTALVAYEIFEPA